MNFVPEFLSRIHYGILVSILKSRLALSQPDTSAPLEQIQLRVMLYQALLSLTGTGGIKALKRETCNSEANTNATYLPSDCSGLIKKEFQQSLIVFSCKPDGCTLDCTEERWLGLQTHQEAFALTHDTWHSNQTSSAHGLCKGISLEFGEGKKKTPLDYNCLWDSPTHTRADLSMLAYERLRLTPWLQLVIHSDLRAMGQSCRISPNSCCTKRDLKPQKLLNDIMTIWLSLWCWTFAWSFWRLKWDCFPRL